MLELELLTQAVIVGCGRIPGLRAFGYRGHQGAHFIPIA